MASLLLAASLAVLAIILVALVFLAVLPALLASRRHHCVRRLLAAILSFTRAALCVLAGFVYTAFRLSGLF